MAKERYVIVGSTFLLLLILLIPHQVIQGQSAGELPSSSAPKETIKIVNPTTTQNVGSGQELLVSGVSSDNSMKDCTVSLIVNDVRPYQNAVAKGTGGTNDFSQWKFVLRTNYTQIIDGENKITAKLTCSSAPTRWYSVFVNGDPNFGNLDLHPVRSESHEELPTMNASDNMNKKSNNNMMTVSVLSEKNPVARGDRQNTTITVTDSNSRAIPNADIDAKLVYPGDNFEKKFRGKTDPQGKFLYSWIIGEKGDVGPLSIEIDVSSKGYTDYSVTNSFDIVDSSSSEINSVSDKSIVDEKSEIDFVTAGDYGCDSVTRNTIKNMEDLNPDLVLALGDLSEVKDQDCFFKIISSLDDGRVKISLGEDGTSGKRYFDYIRHFELEDPYYSFDYRNTHFLAMSTGKGSIIPYEIGSEQYQFVRDDLSKAANNSEIDWIIVYGYRPFYSSPTVHPSSENLRETYPPLFEEYGVDLVITSHNHNYQRSYPLVYNAQHSNLPIIKDVNASHYNAPGAPVYIVAGTAGSNLYALTGQAPYIATQFEKSGFLHVNISEADRDVLSGSFFNIETRNFDDQFVIVKSKFQ